MLYVEGSIDCCAAFAVRPVRSVVLVAVVPRDFVARRARLRHDETAGGAPGLGKMQHALLPRAERVGTQVASSTHRANSHRNHPMACAYTCSYAFTIASRLKRRSQSARTRRRS